MSFQDRNKPTAKDHRGERRLGRDRRTGLDRKKSAAKLGMTLSLGALVATGLMQGRGARTLHIWSGIALVGFSFWHHSLYQSPSREHKD
jgi:hypothetical protein